MKNRSRIRLIATGFAEKPMLRIISNSSRYHASIRRSDRVATNSNDRSTNNSNKRDSYSAETIGCPMSNVQRPRAATPWSAATCRRFWIKWPAKSRYNKALTGQHTPRRGRSWALDLSPFLKIKLDRELQLPRRDYRPRQTECCRR